MAKKRIKYNIQLDLFPLETCDSGTVPESVSKLTKDVVKHIMIPILLKDRKLYYYGAKTKKKYTNNK